MAAIVLDDAAIKKALTPLDCVMIARTIYGERRARPDLTLRQLVQMGEHQHVFSPANCFLQGRVKAYGFRSYPSVVKHHRHEDATCLYNAADGRLLAVHVGRELGAWRNGAAGALAAAQCCDSDRPARVFVFGAGIQAMAQVCCLGAVLRIGKVSVKTRSPQSALWLAEECLARSGIVVELADPSVSELALADIVITATSSPVPVLAADDLPKQVHINAIGPKALNASELDKDVYTTMTTLLTDHLAQLRVDWPTLEASRSGLQPNDFAEPGSGGVASGRSLFICRGLAGAEVWLLASACASACLDRCILR